MTFIQENKWKIVYVCKKGGTDARKLVRYVTSNTGVNDNAAGERGK